MKQRSHGIQLAEMVEAAVVVGERCRESGGGAAGDTEGGGMDGRGERGGVGGGVEDGGADGDVGESCVGSTGEGAGSAASLNGGSSGGHSLRCNLSKRVSSEDCM